ncbi:hypothetical protein [Mesorhizobium sp.]|nr:hypothetical protein [Mesorhizobium sp.]
MTELRVYLLVKDLDRQFAAYISMPIRARIGKSLLMSGTGAVRHRDG